MATTLKDKLKKMAQTTAQAAKSAAEKQAKTTGAKKGTNEKHTPVQTVKNQVKAKAQATSQKAAETGRTAKGAATAKNAGRNAAKKAGETRQAQQYKQASRTAQAFFDRDRFIRDMTARAGERGNAIERGRYLPQKSTGILDQMGIKRYHEEGLTENNPNTPVGTFKTTYSDAAIDRIVKDADLRQKLYSLGEEKVPYKDIIDATTLDPLSALKADSVSHANFGRNVGVKVKEPERTDADRLKAAADAIKERTREGSARQQTLSRFDNRLDAQFREEIRLAKADFEAADKKYQAAIARGDQGKADQYARERVASHERAETWRRLEGGFSGGQAGNEYIQPELTWEDIQTLNKEGQIRLRAAKLGWENAQTDEERARYAAQGEAIRRNPTLQKGEYDRGAYRETDSEGRMRYAGTTEERQAEANQAAAVPKAIGTGIAGSFLSIPSVTGRSLQADAARNQDYLQNLSDIRGGGKVSISEPEKRQDPATVLADLFRNDRYQAASPALKAKKLARAMKTVQDQIPLGERLLQRSDEYRRQATEGQTGLDRYLTEALITGGEMAPGLLATALTGGAAAPGLAVMGAQAAGREMGTLERQGVDPVEAFNRGVVSGAIEAGTELIPLRNLAKIAKGGGDSFARNLLTQALEEVGTEEASELLQYGADKAFKDPNASLTAQDLKDTAVISLLTSLGMGTGAGMVGSRRTGQTQEQQARERKTTAALDQITPTADDLMQQAQNLQNRVARWHQQGARLQDWLANSIQDPTWHKPLLGELEQHEAERKQLEQELIGLETQKARRAEVDQQKAEHEQETAAINQAVDQAMQEVTAANNPVASAIQMQNAPQEAVESPVLNPVTEQVTEPAQQQEPVQGQETPRKTSMQYGQPENHIDNRQSEDLGSRNVKAFQWDHPEIKPFYQKAAQALKIDAEYSDATRQNVRGSKKDQALGRKLGTVMQRNDALNMLHRMGLSTPEIIWACDAIINDQGQENYAAAKRVELALNDMLSKGYTPVEANGNPDAFVGPDADYLRIKGEISGGVAPGSWEAYRRDHDFVVETGEVTEDELWREWEAERFSARQTAEESTEDTNAPVFQTKEEELSYLRDRAETLISQREQAASGTPEDRAQWNREWDRLQADIRDAQERWSGQESREEEFSEDGAQDVMAENDLYSVGAAPGGFDPFSRMANEYGTIEPGENPSRIVDVPLSTDGEDRVRRYVRTAMEAEATPDEAVEAFEQDVANGLFSYRRRRDADALAAATNTIEAKGFDGARQQWQDVVDGNRIAGKDDIVLAQMLYSLAARHGDLDTARRLAAEIAAEGTVAGQKIQALQLLKKATPEGRLYYIRRCVQKMQSDLNEKMGDKAPELEIDPELEGDLLDAETAEDQMNAMDQIYDDVARQLPPTLADRLNAWRYFAMLGNPRTHIRNIVGNLVVQVPLQASNKVSALVQASLPKEKRTRSLTVSRAARRFARQDFQEMRDVLSGDKFTSDESEIRRRQKLFPKILQAPMDFNSRALEGEDMFFKKRTYIRSLAEFITARGWDPETIDGDQLEQARTHAVKDALHATFQDSSAFADWLTKQENKNKAAKIIVGGLVPFKRVPINIAKMGFELSPAGLVKAITRDSAKVRKGEMDATDMIDHLTRGMTGTAIAGLGYFLAAQGLLTAGGDGDDKEHYFDMAQGSQDYALDLGDYTYTIDWASPSAIPLFLGAEFHNARKKWGEGSDEDEGKAFKDGLESLTRLFDPMLNMTVLSGISDTLKTISYSKINAAFPLLWSVGQNFAGQFVPTLSGQIARTIDPTRRTTYVDRNSPIPNSVQKFIQKQENKIPGLSQKNSPYLDVWGREDRTDNPLLRAFENFISPGYVSKRNTDAVDEELQRLHDLDYDGVLPSKAQTDTKINDRYLSKDEYEKLVRTQGSQARNMLAEVIGTPEYQGLTDDEKAAYVKKIFDFSKQIGKLEAGMPEEKADSYVLKAREGQDTLGLDPSKYLAMAALKASIDKDETTDDKTMKAIDFSLAVDARSDMTDEQKQFVKDNIKFFNMFPVSTASFEKGLAAGLTAEESKEMLALKKSADVDGNNSYTNLELYDAINNSGKTDEQKAKLWEAMKPANSNKSWNDIQKESKEAAAAREKWSASIGDVSQETIDTFNQNVNNVGGYNSMTYTSFFDMMDSMGVPESQRAGYYAIVQSNKGHPWKKTYAEAKKYKGR